MAIFKPTEVTLALDLLTIRSAEDRVDGVEPYVVPIFFKVDGQRYAASLRIMHTQQPRENTTEQPGGRIQLTVDTFKTGIWPIDAEENDIQEDNPLLWVPDADLLVRGSVQKGEQIIMRDVSFTSYLEPIPIRIDVLGEYVTPSESFQQLLRALHLENQVDDAINFIFTSLNDLIGDLFGLETDEKCPATEEDSYEFLKNIEAQFKGLIPGTIGGVFVCMENDAFNESHAQDLRSSIRDEVASAINDTVNAINENNPVADPERFLNVGEIEDHILSDLRWPVIVDAGLSFGSIVASVVAGNVPVGIYGILTSLSWVVGGKDDPIGQITVKYDHTNLGAPGSVILRSQVMTTKPDHDDNVWELSYTLTVN